MFRRTLSLVTTLLAFGALAAATVPSQAAATSDTPKMTSVQGAAYIFLPDHSLMLWRAQCVSYSNGYAGGTISMGGADGTFYGTVKSASNPTANTVVTQASGWFYLPDRTAKAVTAQITFTKTTFAIVIKDNLGNTLLDSGTQALQTGSSSIVAH